MTYMFTNTEQRYWFFSVIFMDGNFERLTNIHESMLIINCINLSLLTYITSHWASKHRNDRPLLCRPLLCSSHLLGGVGVSGSMDGRGMCHFGS